MPNEQTIAENLQRLVDAKDAIAAAITAKGGTVGQDDGLEEFPTAINGISTGVDTSNDTVTAATLKSGYTAHNAAGQQITGTMLSQPTTATAETIKEGFTAYNAAGELITGTLVVPSGVYNWQEIQRRVKNNDMSFISIGDQFICGYGSSTLTWDVIGKNQDTPANPNYTYSLTLRLHNQLPLTDVMRFDTNEAFYYCSSQLSAGTYCYWYNGYWKQFTLTKTVPAGGQLYLYGSSVYTYSSATSTTPIEAVSLTNGQSGTSLGSSMQAHAKSENFNAYHRAIYGNNNWNESNIRQWLNSNKPAGQWWTPQNPWDRPPDYASTLNGFLYDLDPDFVDALGLTNKVTTYSSADGTGTYTTADTMFLLSQTEVYGGNRQSGYPEGQAYTFYSANSSLSAPGTGADTNRITYKNGTTKSYNLRTPHPSVSSYICFIKTNGAFEDYSSGQPWYANSDRGVLPACCII